MEQILYRSNSEEILCKAIKKIRSNRPKVRENLPFTVNSHKTFCQIWINSSACWFSVKGYCSICDYWDGKFSDSDITAVCKYIQENLEDCETLLLNTCGSCLCEKELPEDALMRLLSVIAKSSIRYLILETHLAYITYKKIQKKTRFVKVAKCRKALFKTDLPHLPCICLKNT